MKHVRDYNKFFPDWKQKDVENVMTMYLREEDTDSWNDINESIMDTDPQVGNYQYTLWKHCITLSSLAVGRLFYMITLKSLEKGFP